MKIIAGFVFLLIALISIVAFSNDERNSWYWLVAAAVANSACVSVWLVWQSKKLKTFTEKAMGFGAWFWFLIFIQVMIYGFYVALTK